MKVWDNVSPDATIKELYPKGQLIQIELDDCQSKSFGYSKNCDIQLPDNELDDVTFILFNRNGNLFLVDTTKKHHL